MTVASSVLQIASTFAPPLNNSSSETLDDYYPQTEFFQAMYERLNAIGMTVAIRLFRGDRLAAEEVVQDAFIAAWQHHHTYDVARGTEKAWFLQIVRNRAIDRIRPMKYRIVHSQIDDRLVYGDTAGVWPAVETMLNRSRLEQVLQLLPDTQQQVIQLIYFAGHTTGVAGRMIGVPTGTVKSRLRLALKLLRLLLTDNEMSRG